MTELEKTRENHNLVDYNQSREDVITLRRKFVTARRLIGAAYEDILEEWNGQEGMPETWKVNRIQTLGMDYKLVMKELAETTLQDAALIRESSRLRLENMYNKLQHKIQVGDTNAIGAAIKIETRLAEMYGSDMPTKVAITDTAGRDIPQMTDEERMARLNELLRKAEERRRIEEGEPDDDARDAFRDDPEPSV